MKLLNITALFTCASLAAAEVTFLVSLKPLPGKEAAATQFMAKTIDQFHQLKPKGQLELFAFQSADGRVVGVEKYTDEKAALDWALSKTHVDALMPMVGLFDLFSAQITTDASLKVKNQLSSSFKGSQ